MYTQQQKQHWLNQLTSLETTQPEAVGIAREILQSEEHHGWINKETFMAALHTTSDYDLYHKTLTTIEQVLTRRHAADEIAETARMYQQILHHEHRPAIPHVWAMLLADVGSLWRVDWEAVVG